jgi:hypothetical protein
MNINSKSAVTSVLLAASVLPAWGQFRERGSDHGFDRSGHAQAVQPRSFQSAPEQRNLQRGDSFRNRTVPQVEQHSQPAYQQRQFAPSQPAYRPDMRFNDGDRYRGNAERYEHNTRGYGYRGSRGYVIPQNRFYSNFGREHFFRIGRPVFYGRYPRFQYGGFWFSFVTAPPAYWGPDWYSNDDVYIDYNNGGYYLYDNRYPGQGVPLEVDNGDGYDGGYGPAPDGAYGDPYSGGYDGSYPPPY